MRSFSLQSLLSSEQPFYGKYSTLDSHTNTVISHAVAYPSKWLPPGDMRKPSGLKTRSVNNKRSMPCAKHRPRYHASGRRPYQSLFRPMAEVFFPPVRRMPGKRPLLAANRLEDFNVEI